MKKLLVAILAIVYLTTSIGATIHLHYCMDKLVAWGFRADQTNKKSCPFCGMTKTKADKHCGKETKGCCKDEQKQVKVDKDQKTPDAGLILSKPFPQIADQSSFALSPIAVTSPVLEFPTSNSPPRAEEISLFLRNCVFRI